MGDIRWAPEQVTQAGLTATYNTPTTTDTYKIRNDGKIALNVLKTGAGSCNVVVVTPGTVGSGSYPIGDLTVSVPATTGKKFIGPFEPSVFNDASGDIAVTFSEVTGLTAAVIRIG